MATLVTGGAGFIGSHVARKLIEKGEEVVIVDNFNTYYDPKLKEQRVKVLLGTNSQYKLYRFDISNFESLKHVFETNHITSICHLAARAGVRASIEDPFTYHRANNTGTLNILEMAREFEVENMTFASSSSVYGNTKQVPFREDARVDFPVSPYAATKKNGELMCYNYHHLYQIPITCLRFFTVYGPWGRPDMAYFKFAKRIVNNEPIDVYNYGRELKRDFTYIDDIVSGIIASLDKKLPFAILNLGNNKPVELMYFIAAIEKNLGITAQKNFLPMQLGDVMITYADISKAQELLGYSPKTSIDTGLANFIRWFKNYHATQNFQ